jgi:hypothetical protein
MPVVFELSVFIFFISFLPELSFISTFSCEFVAVQCNHLVLVICLRQSCQHFGASGLMLNPRCVMREEGFKQKTLTLAKNFKPCALRAKSSQGLQWETAFSMSF